MGYFTCSATSKANCIVMMFVPRGQCPQCFACVLGYHPPPGSLKLAHSKWWDDVSSCGVIAYSVLDSLSGESNLCLHSTTVGMEKVFPLSMMACCQACFRLALLPVPIACEAHPGHHQAKLQSLHLGPANPSSATTPHLAFSQAIPHYRRGNWFVLQPFAP